MAGIETVAAGLTHDIRGAFGLVKLLAGRAARELRRGDTRSALDTLGRLDRAVGTGTELCEDVLECGRRRAIDAHLTRERVDVAMVVRDCVALHAGAIDEARSPVHVDAPASAVIVSHRKSLERIVTNVLRNALAHGAGRPIEIRVDAVAYGAVVTVLDHGRGIPRESIERIFRPWLRGDPDDHAFQRFGLGLWIVKTLIASLGGTLHVTSDPESGCAIRFFAPSST